MIKRICIIVLLLGSSVSFAKSGQSGSAYIPPAHTVGEKGHQLSVVGSYFQSTGSYDNSGALLERTEGTSFSSINTEATVRYGISEAFEVRLGGRYRMNSSNDGASEFTVSGFESYFGGAKYRFRPYGKLTYALDAQYRASAHSSDKYDGPINAPTDEMILGDQGTEITTGLHLAYALTRQSTFSAYGAYRIPYDDLSDEVIFNAELAWRTQGNGFAALLGVEGIHSLETSEYSEDPTGRPYAYAGDTQLYNSVNRSYMAPYVGVNLSSGSIALQLKAAAVVMGNWTDAGYEFSSGLVFTGLGKKQSYRKVDKFKEYEIEASVIKLSPRGKFVKIDQGVSHDVTKNMKIDIYKTDYFGGNILVASGRVYQVGSDWAIVKLAKKFRKVQIRVGFTARGY
ncbi:MAG: hypothetical protein KAG61_02960 [Bacteriovoracaceae bacterium]|nr:hypothetical protein [Bacteriovoracaceae bacterium]